MTRIIAGIICAVPIIWMSWDKLMDATWQGLLISFLVVLAFLLWLMLLSHAVGGLTFKDYKRLFF
jgi:uncharacterized protein (DUF983 family)